MVIIYEKMTIFKKIKKKKVEQKLGKKVGPLTFSECNTPINGKSSTISKVISCHVRYLYIFVSNCE
jgi:hypothetical protein